MQSNRGQFITLEGVEGVGKSSAIEFIRTLFEKYKIEYQVFREPGGTPFSEKIRALLLEDTEETVASDTELLLMFACRAQNIEKIVKPALNQGCWVLADRFVDASYAYQGGGRGIENERLNTLADWVLADLEPDVTLLLDAPVEVGFERLRIRGKKDRIEQEEMDFFERARAVYLKRATLFKHRFSVVDASMTLDQVNQQIENALTPILRGK